MDAVGFRLRLVVGLKKRERDYLDNGLPVLRHYCTSGCSNYNISMEAPAATFTSVFKSVPAAPRFKAHGSE